MERAQGRALGSRGLREKQKVYRTSKLRLTKQLASKRLKTWDRRAIERRQAALAELALAAWPRPTQG
jgi:hypothetical protein